LSSLASWHHEAITKFERADAMTNIDDFMLIYEQRQRAVEIERHDREIARREASARRCRTGLFARLFHPGHSPWTVPTTKRPGRRITATAEIGRLDL
jgi:hypothetical protein